MRGRERASDGELLRAYLADRDVPCPQCGYNLRGCQRGECPECGFGFNLGALRPLDPPDDGFRLRELWTDPGLWCVPLASLVVLMGISVLVGSNSFGGAAANQGWFERITRPPLVLLLAAALACVSLRVLELACAADTALEERIYPKVAAIVWAIVAIAAVGVAWTAVLRLAA